VRRSSKISYNLDYILILFYILFVLTGWLNIYSAVLNTEHSSILDISQKYGKQLITIAASVILIFVILMLDGKFYERFSGLIYVGAILSLMGLFVFGKKVAGATSWYGVGSFSIQPSEFAKFATALAFAKLFTNQNFNLRSAKQIITVGLVIFLPAVLITLQPDPGSALVYTAFIFVMYREGLNGHFLFIGLISAVLFLLSIVIPYTYLMAAIIIIGIVLFIIRRRKKLKNSMLLFYVMFSLVVLTSVDFIYNSVFEDRHRNRLEILLGLKHDPTGVGYNQHQSMVAIGSGGLDGKGFLKGTQTKGEFVPEQSTDFIFCTVGEEWGFIGSTAFVILFTIFLIRIIVKAEKQKLRFSRVYGYSVAMIFAFHFFINIAMVLGIAPVIGIPLPFYSYGGSSLWGFTILLFIFIRLDAENHSIL
jgi:rod shape determining protein RodA